jgi:SAM-dependent methyltransferase
MRVNQIHRLIRQLTSYLVSQYANLKSVPAKCPICIARSEFISHAVVAPWISALLTPAKPKMIESQLYKCHSCQISFFSYRYSRSELELLYQNYRASAWFALRHSWEPWYRKSTNNAYSDNNSEKNLIERENYTEELLSMSGLDIENLGDYLDFGGDAGQFFPNGVRGRRILFDLQQRQISGVEVITNPSEIQGLVSIVSSCYVLEHTPEVNDSIREMKSCLKDNGHLLIELPYDIFNVSRFCKTDLYKRYLSFIYKFKTLFILSDFVSGIFRQFFNSIPPFGVVKQSEHINYFKLKSLTKLLEDHGFEIKSEKAPIRKSFVGLIKQGKFGVVAVKSGD